MLDVDKNISADRIQRLEEENKSLRKVRIDLETANEQLKTVVGRYKDQIDKMSDQLRLEMYQ